MAIDIENVYAVDVAVGCEGHGQVQRHLVLADPVFPADHGDRVLVLLHATLEPLLLFCERSLSVLDGFLLFQFSASFSVKACFVRCQIEVYSLKKGGFDWFRFRTSTVFVEFMTRVNLRLRLYLLYQVLRGPFEGR
jgi:hypothetical protein